ncbi:MAG TPA: choline-sulfatase, partial [Pseudoduganella sp.]
VDLLPTLLDLAQAGTPLEAAGRSLLPHLEGRGGHDEVAAEYLAEGALAPIVMLRRGPYKFVHSPADPDQLYHLADDPDELRNLAGDPGRHAAALDSLRADAARRWDLAALHRRVLASQRRRHLIGAANALGVAHAWDYEPPRDASRKYIRRHLDLDTLEARARFPAIHGEQP